MRGFPKSTEFTSVKGNIVFIDEMDTDVHDLLITGMMNQIIPEITG